MSGWTRRIEGHWAELTRHEEWNIGLVDAPIQRFLEPDFIPEVHWQPVAGPDLYRADPFAPPGPPGGPVLCEEYDQRTGRGYLVSLEQGRSRRLQGFPEAWHASYPYIVERGGEYYCTPEIWESGAARLYRATRFPEAWAMAGTMAANFWAVDNTVFEHEGRWWLACTNCATDPNGELWLFHAPDLGGPWEGHAANPVKRDPASARPAGTPFRHQGALYRPAQDCTRTYGGAVVIQRVDRLTPEEFVETPVRVVAPRPDWPWPDGLHTLSAAGEQTWIDAKREVFNGAAFRRILWRKLTRLARPSPGTD